MWGPYVCISAYKHDVVVIKMGAYIHGILTSVGAYYPDLQYKISEKCIVESI